MAHTAQAEADSAELLASLRTELDQFIAELSAEEPAQHAYTTAFDGVDTTGFTAAVYEDEDGYKGRPQGTAGGGRLVGIIGGAIWHQSGFPQAIRAVRYYL